jgi:hypothetical protein
MNLYRSFPVFCFLTVATLALGCGEQPTEAWSDSFAELSTEWKWNLGTWTAKNGVLRGFQSGKRDHGPSINRRIDLKNFRVAWEFRMVGKAHFSGIGFNRNPKGHLLHLVTGRNGVTLIAHPGGDAEKFDAIRDPQPLSIGDWHRAVLEIRGEKFSLELDGRNFAVEHPCIGEVKTTLILGGDSGGPEGEAAGALEYRNLSLTPLP